MDVSFDLLIEECTDRQLADRVKRVPDAIGKLHSRARLAPDTLGRIRGYLPAQRGNPAAGA